MDTVSIGGSWLQPGSDEFDHVEHALRMSIVDGRIPTDIDIWEINCNEVKNRYQRRTESLLKLTAFVNPEYLSEENSVRNLCVRGDFQFPEKGMEFTTGIVTTLPSSSKQQESKLSIILAEIAVGKSAIKDNIDSCSSILPAGYDSYYITEQPLDQNHDGEFSLSEYQDAATFNHRDPRAYQHKYFLTDCTLALPKYVIRFNLPQVSHFLPSNSPKKTVRIGPAVTPSAPAAGNTFLATEYFDMTNFKPLSKLERDECNESEVRIYTIDEAYEKACVELKFADPLVSGKLDWVEKQLDITEEKVRAVNLNYAEVADKLLEEYNAAKNKLNAITQRKLETILSTEIDFRRQKEQLLWCQCYAEDQIAKADSILSGKVGGSASFAEKKEAKLELLRTWKCQVALRNELGRLRDSRAHAKSLASVKSDTRAYISIEVIDGKRKDGEEQLTTTPRNAKYVVAGETDMKTATPATNPLRRNSNMSNSKPIVLGDDEDDDHSALGNDEGDRYGEEEDDDGKGGVDEVYRLMYPVYSNESGPASSSYQSNSIRSQQTFQFFQNFVESQTNKIKSILIEKSRLAEDFFQNKDCLPLPSSVFRHGGILGEKYCASVPAAVVVPIVVPSETRDVVRDTSVADANHILSNQRRVYVDPKALFKDVLRLGVDPASAEFHPDQAASDASSKKRTPNKKTSQSGDSPASTVSKMDDMQPPSPQSSISAASVAPSIANSTVSGSFRVSKSATTPVQNNRQFVGVKPSMVAGNKMQTMTVQSNLSPTPKSPLRPVERYSISSSVAAASTVSAGSKSRKPLAYGSVTPGNNNNNVQQKMKPSELEAKAKSHLQAESVDDQGSVADQHIDEESLLADNFLDNASIHSVAKVSLPLAVLKKTAKQFPQLSMRHIADRKISQLQARHITNYDENLMEFRNSNILAKPEAEAIYFCLPFLSKPPLVKLLYSTGLHSRSLNDIYTKNISHRGPCLMVIRSSDFIFGGYFSHPLMLSGAWAGGPACFLFSVTLDLKIPFHARCLASECNGELAAFLVERDLLTIGNNDIVIGNAIREGESDLEHVFGVGLDVDSAEARCLLAGTSHFTIDDLEVWGITI